MGRKNKDEEREKDSRESRKRRHKGASRSKSRSRSRERDRDLSKAKRAKQERDGKEEKIRDIKEEKTRDIKEEKNRDTRDKDRPKKIKEDRDLHGDRENKEDHGKTPKEHSSGKAPQVTASNTNETSISIEETNRIRAELGLKPLDLGDDATGDAGNSESATEKKDVHVPAENIGTKKKTEELKRKIDERRERRKIEQGLTSIRPIAQQATEEDDNAASWVEKMRRIQKEKEAAAKRAKMLEEMDRELGVSDIVQTELLKEKSQAYTGKNLKGLRVEHDQEHLAEGKTVLLTLKDQNVLDADEDVLININMLDDERYKKNNEIKKQKPGYQAFEDQEVDELTGMPKTRSLLAKYDSEIDGDQKSSFVIGVEGSTDQDSTKLSSAELMKRKLKEEQKRIESLESRPLQVASEYYTEQEMVSFKKPKRRVKKPRRNQMLRADDLLQQGAADDDSSAHLGSRSRPKSTIVDDDDVKVPTEDLSGVQITVDDSPVELRQALDRSRRLKEKKTDFWSLENVAKSIKREPEEKLVTVDVPMSDEEANRNANIVLNATAEFCRTLGDIPTYGMAGNRDEDKDELLDFERQLAEERRRNVEKEERRREAERLQERGGWNVLERDENERGSDDSDMDVEGRDGAENATVILDEEPDVSSGMAAALKLAMSKGYLEKEEKKRGGVSKSGQELLAKTYTIEDKALDDDKHSRRNRYDGPLVEFKDKEGYKPEVKLDYMGDDGKMLNTKEAFRHLSHKFHGKGSGKLKSEKRTKKQEDKMLMNRMSSTDTPLHTLKKLQDKQKELQSPYVVLSGKLTSTSITKPMKGKK